MVSANKKTLWVTGLSLELLHDEEYIPTVVSYSPSAVNVGSRALDDEYKNIPSFVEFKLGLGNSAPGKRQETYISGGLEKTSSELTSAFFEKTLEGSLGITKLTDNSKTKILIAEPLAFQVGGKNEWLTNYRAHIKKILHNFESVDFLPEPFAVYQYYRYGLKHAVLQENREHVALIIDFGGGTFDASIVASKKDGDISYSGANSRPLSADSDAVGGFYINKIIARELFKDQIGDGRAGDKAKIGKYFEWLLRGRSGGTPGLSVSERSAIDENLWKSMRRIEAAKIKLASRISDWGLKVPCNETVEIEVPDDPLGHDTEWKTILLSGHRLRNLFRQEIWDKRLKKVVRLVFDRASRDIEERPVTVTLISGGSSNIRWLEKLLVEDFSTYLSLARPIPLSESFQEIVAKGLAIECARRFYSADTEFNGVTYNPIRLILDPDGRGPETPKYRSIGEVVDMSGLRDGDLLPSAQVLKEYIDHPIRWKTKLTHPPRTYLEYYFIRPTENFDPLNKDSFINESYNISSTRQTTKKETNFDQNIKIELVIKEDRTVIPKFIYRSEDTKNGVPEEAVFGDAFAIDATTVDQVVAVNKYIGFDFGTSNTSLVCLSNENIGWIEKNKNAESQEISDLIDLIPGPIAEGIKRYLGVSALDKAALWREAFELCLTFLAYSLLAEQISVVGPVAQILKNFRHRSFGPLKGLIDACLTQGLKADLLDLVSPYFGDDGWLNDAIESCNNEKHDKGSIDDGDRVRLLKRLSRIIVAVTDSYYFGHLRAIQPKRFSRDRNIAIFEVAHGTWPYLERMPCEFAGRYGAEDVFLVRKDDGKAFPIVPLIFVEIGEEDRPTYQLYDGNSDDAGYPLYKIANKKDAQSCAGLAEAVRDIVGGKLTAQQVVFGFPAKE